MLIRKIGNFSYSMRQRNNTIIHDFPLAYNILDILLRNNRYNHNRFSIFLRNDRDYNDVDLLKTRKRYVVRESLDFTRNMFWLASCFSKIKKPNNHFLGNQCGIAGVCIFDTTHASMRVHHSKILHFSGSC